MDVDNNNNDNASAQEQEEQEERERWRDIDTILERPSNLAGPGFEPGPDLRAFLASPACRVLVVGAGGLGCELLKDLALSGFRHIDVIDMDTIDVSNLNRQFLFRTADVGKPKAVVAAAKVEGRVAGCRVLAHHARIEDMPADFYAGFTAIVLGLDSLEARRYMNGVVCGMLAFEDAGQEPPQQQQQPQQQQSHQQQEGGAAVAGPDGAGPDAAAAGTDPAAAGADAAAGTDAAPPAEDTAPGAKRRRGEGNAPPPASPPPAAAAAPPPRPDPSVDLATVKPVIDGGTEGFKGHARVILPGLTPCFECTLWLFPPQVRFPLCTLAETPRTPAHCIEYAHLIRWGQDRPDEPFDAEDEGHMAWVLEVASARAAKHGIAGVTASLAAGVVKGIVPAVASTNAVVSAACVLETLKTITMCSQGLDNYMMCVWLWLFLLVPRSPPVAPKPVNRAHGRPRLLRARAQRLSRRNPEQVNNNNAKPTGTRGPTASTRTHSRTSATRPAPSARPASPSSARAAPRFAR